MDLYIYYQADLAHADALQEKVRMMQASLHTTIPVAAALRRRPDTTDGRHTWMEIYPDVPAGFEALLERAVAQSALSLLIVGKRHTEYFVEPTPCA